MTAVAFDVVAVQDACNEAAQQARTATKAFLAKHGDRDACGFAYVDVYGVRSNSKLGKALQAAGFSKSYKGSLQLWNPSGHHTQCITAKEEGAEAYAKVLREKLGLERCYAGSNMD
jgi:virulence-associated protein VapD